MTTAAQEIAWLEMHRVYGRDGSNRFVQQIHGLGDGIPGGTFDFLIVTGVAAVAAVGVGIGVGMKAGWKVGAAVGTGLLALDGLATGAYIARRRGGVE